MQRGELKGSFIICKTFQDRVFRFWTFGIESLLFFVFLQIGRERSRSPFDVSVDEDLPPSFVEAQDPGTPIWLYCHHL